MRAVAGVAATFSSHAYGLATLRRGVAGHAGGMGGRAATLTANRPPRPPGPPFGLTMSDPIHSEPHSPTTPKRRGNPAMRRGAPSLNPAGRPKVGQSLAEAVRSAVSPEELAERMLKLADGADSEQVRFSALAWLGERGHGKVTSDHSVTLKQGTQPDHNQLAAALTDAELEVLDAAHRRLALSSGEEASVIDGETTNDAA